MDSALSSTVPPFITDRQEILSTAIKLPKYQICQLDGKSSGLSSLENNFAEIFQVASSWCSGTRGVRNMWWQP